MFWFYIHFQWNLRSTFHCIYKPFTVTKPHSLLFHVVKPAQYNHMSLCQFSVISTVRIKQVTFNHYYMHSLRTQTTGCPDAHMLQEGDTKPSVQSSIKHCTNLSHSIHKKNVHTVLPLTFQNCIKVKWSRYRPGVAQRVGRGIALLFHDRGTRTGWVVSSTPRPHFTPGKDPVPILQVAGWAPGPVWTGGKSHPHRDSILDRPARSSVAIPTELPGPFSKL